MKKKYILFYINIQFLFGIKIYNPRCMKENTLNMTEGNPVRLILIFSVPMLVGNIFQQLYNLADSVIVGQLIGADALAAIGSTGSITFFFFAICNGFGAGGGIVASQSFGEGDKEKVKNCIANVAYLMFLVPAVIGTIAFFTAGQILVLLNTPESILPVAKSYMRIMCLSIIFVSLYNFASSMLRAIGDSKTPLYFLIFSCFLNVGLDILFVLYFNMGVFGAGVATLISQLISGALCLIYAIKSNSYFKLSRQNLRVNFLLMWKCIKIGIPLSLQFSLIAISCMALQRVVNSFGAVAVAAFAATSRVEQIIHMPYQTLSAALSTYCGQNFGAKKYDRMINGYRKAMLMMATFTICMIPVVQIFGHGIIRMFVKETSVIEMGAKAIKITSLFYIFLGMIYTVRGILNGMGDSFFAMLNGIVEVIGRFTVPFILVAIPVIGVWGIWWSLGLVWFMAGTTAWWRYLYMKKKILK